MSSNRDVDHQLWIEGLLDVYEGETEEQAFQRLEGIGFLVEEVDNP